VQALTGQVNQAVASMQASVAALRDITTDSSRRLEGSAQTLGLAADNFAKAGNSVHAVMQQTGQVSDKMAGAALSLNQASGTVEQALAHYNEAGQAMIQMVEALKTTVEVARQDAAVSQSLVDQIRQAAEHLKTANTEVNGVFEKVCEELANAHEAFAKNIDNSLRRGNTAYQKELKDAVDYLKTAIEELGDVAEKIPGRK
jgi:methyl-accepting chemotaxis protein